MASNFIAYLDSVKARDPAAVRVLVRGLVEIVDRDPGRGRRPLHGTVDQVLDDLAALGAQGVTDVFVDLNFSPLVGSPDVDAGAATAYADHVLQALAPAGRPSAPTGEGRSRRRRPWA